MSKYRSDDLNRIAGYFKALSNPHRLDIFIKLVSCCVPGTKCPPEDGVKACVGELGNDLELAASTVSHHIKELHRAGLLRMERAGQHVECWVDEMALKELSEFFTNCSEGILPSAFYQRILE